MLDIFIDPDLLEVARKVYQSLMQSDEKNEPKKKNKMSCNPKWPICHEQLHRNKVQLIDPEPWVIKEEGPPRIIDNYLESKSKQTKIYR